MEDYVKGTGEFFGETGVCGFGLGGLGRGFGWGGGEWVVGLYLGGWLQVWCCCDGDWFLLKCREYALEGCVMELTQIVLLI